MEDKGVGIEIEEIEIEIQTMIEEIEIMIDLDLLGKMIGEEIIEIIEAMIKGKFIFFFK